VISRKARNHVASTARAAVAGGSLIGLSRVAPASLAVLGATVVVLALVLVSAGYKMLDRVLQHFEPQSPDSLQHVEQQQSRRLRL
jgi:Na+/H+-translocating membrane pyrophosphatase